MAGPKDTEDVPERRPVTRSLVQGGLVTSSVPSGSTSPAKKTKGKKVKFVEPDNSAAHNSSVATDEGIDLSFSSPRASASIKIPASIVRPHHGLGQAWTFWFSGSNKRDSWSQDLVTVANMKTVEDFWTIYNQVCLTPVCRSDGCAAQLFLDPALQSPEGRPVLLCLQNWRCSGLGGSRQQGRGALDDQLQHRGEEGPAGPEVAGAPDLCAGGQDGTHCHR